MRPIDDYIRSLDALTRGEQRRDNPARSTTIEPPPTDLGRSCYVVSVMGRDRFVWADCAHDAREKATRHHI